MRLPGVVVNQARTKFRLSGRAGGFPAAIAVRHTVLAAALVLCIVAKTVCAQGRVPLRPTVGLGRGVESLRSGALSLLPQRWLRLAAAPDSAIVRLSAFRYNLDPACATAFFVDGSGLLLTTYQAIRGAEQVEMIGRNGQLAADQVGVASYSVAQDVAVLYVDRDNAPSLTLGGSVVAGDVVTHLGFGDGAAPVSSQLTVREWQHPPTGPLRLTGRQPACGLGGPLTNRAGTVVGVVTSDTTALPIQRAVPVVELARESVTSGSIQSLRQVAEQEHHLYGSVVFLSQPSALNARIRPLETWHWLPVLQFTTPFGFNGPMGRYEVQVLLEGRVNNTVNVEVRPTVTLQINLFPAARGGGGGSSLPRILGAVGLAAGGLAVASVVVPLGGDGADEPPTCPSGQRWDAVAGRCVPATTSTTGGIIITWQDPNR